MNEQTPVDGPVAQLTGRGFGKTAAMRGPRTEHGIQDETSAQTDEILNRPKLMPGRLRMRRSGQGPAGKATTARIEGKEVAIPACPHLETVHVRAPHPKYGDKVPYYETYQRRPEAHVCLSVRPEQ